MVRIYNEGEKMNRDQLEYADLIVFLLVTAAITVLISLTSTPPSRLLFAQQHDNGFLTYENPDYSIKLDYPANWTKSEINLAAYQVAYFYPAEINRSIFDLVQPVSVSISVRLLPNSSMSLKQLVTALESYFNGNVKYRIVDQSNTTLSGMPAYQIVHYSYVNNETRKWLEIASPLDNEMFEIKYQTEPGYFDSYLPVVKRMIESFQITRSNDSNSMNNDTSKNVLQEQGPQQQGMQLQLISTNVDSRDENNDPSAPSTSSDGCAEGWGYHVDDPSPICEPLDKIGQGPPPEDMAFCAALGCPYNPPADSAEGDSESEMATAATNDDNADINNFDDELTKGTN